MALLEVDSIKVRFGGIVALDGPSFTVDAGQICGLIGPNGAGKTTLFNCVSRIYTPNSGSVTFDGRDLLALPAHKVADVGVARTFQNLGLFPTQTVLDNVMIGAHHVSKANFLTGAVRVPGVMSEEHSTRDRALDILRRLDLIDYADNYAVGLPYGTLKRIEIARALMASPRLLLLDEPAGGLTHGEVDEFGELVRQLRTEFDMTVLLVEHHMAMVMAISDKIVVLDFGRKIAEGTPREIQENPAVIEAYLGGSA